MRSASSIFALVAVLVLLVLASADSTHAAQLDPTIAKPTNDQSSLRGTDTQTATTTPQTLEESIASTHVSAALIGDGTSTSHCKLVLTNRTNQPQRIIIPTGQFFLPSNPAFQIMMVTEGQTIDVPPSETISTAITTVCASTRLIKPPPSEGVSYMPGSYPDQTVGTIITSIVDAAHRLSQEHAYDHLAIAQERRQPTVSQLAIWRMLGERTSVRQDNVTRESIRSQILETTGTPVESLTPREHRNFNERVNQIFSAVDLTLKQGKRLASTTGTPGSGSTKGGPSHRTGEPTTPVTQNPPPATEVRPLRLGIHLYRQDDSWIPINPGLTPVTAQLYEQDRSSSRWVPTNQRRRISFHITQTSNERGECLNSGSEKTPDLYLPQEENTTLQCQVDPSGQNHYFQGAYTRDEETRKTTFVGCEDFGAWGDIQATCLDCAILRQGNGLSGDGATDSGELHEVVSHAVKLPKDDNLNQIADAYEDRVGQHPRATDDQDRYPRGDGVNGDGLSAYEEYRGFRSMRQHKRTSWIRKDLFIHDRDGLADGVYKYQDASFIRCHLIKPEEYNGDAQRVINFNSGHANVVTQHGLLLVDEMQPGGILGYTFTLANAAFPVTPKKVEKVAIDWLKIQALGGIRGLSSLQTISATAAHELGHATHVVHHSDQWRRDALDRRIERGVATALYNAWTRPTLCGLPLPRHFWLGLPQNRMSGDEQCIMRYPNPTECIYANFSGRVFDCAPTSWNPDWFCVTPNGHSFNGGNHCAGSALRGDCQAQFQVNDGQ